MAEDLFKYKPDLNQKYDGIEKYIFRDAYRFFIKFKSMPNIEENWAVLERDREIFYFKYKDHPFAKAMIDSVVEQLRHENYGTELNGFTHEQWEERLEVAKRSKPWSS